MDPSMNWGLRVRTDEVHVWWTSLSQAGFCVHELARTLSADERRRADRYLFERDRRRFVVARATLRSILGRYLGIEPPDIRFVYGSHGRPELDRLPRSVPIRFNAAHSGDVAVYAVTGWRAIGIDAERVRPLRDPEHVAGPVLSVRERDMLRGLPATERLVAFFRCWTRKEAYLKARGDGWSARPQEITVALGPEKPPQVLTVDGDPREAGRWSLYDLEAPATGYIAALAVEGGGCQIQRRRWPD